MRRAAFMLAAASIALASCTTDQHNDATAKAKKIVDTVCQLEPTVFSGYDAYVAIHPVSTKADKLVRDADITVTQLCKDRPTDVVSGSISLLAAYAKIAAGLGGNAPKINVGT